MCELARYNVNPAYQGIKIIHYCSWKKKECAIKQNLAPPIERKDLLKAWLIYPCDIFYL